MRWWDALLKVLTALAQPDLGTIAIDGTSATTLLVDPNGEPTTPGLMYNDSRAETAAARIADFAPSDSPARGAGSSLAKALHLRAQAPGRVQQQSDWLSARLCGRFGWTDENNALKLGYDVQQRQWPQWLLSLLPDADFLPEVVQPGTPVGRLAPQWCQLLGIAEAPLIVAGTTDSTAAFLATGAAEPGDAVTSLGSTLVLKVVADRPIASARHGVYSHRLGDLWLAGGASNAGGAVLRQYFADADLARLSKGLSKGLNPYQPSGLDYYPLARPGERFPIADPDLAPRLTPRPANQARFLQGMLEGLTRIEAQGYRLLQELGAPWPKRVFSVGGGATNPVWTAMRAAALGVPLNQPRYSEAAYGAALLARQGALKG